MAVKNTTDDIVRIVCRPPQLNVVQILIATQKVKY